MTMRDRIIVSILIVWTFLNFVLYTFSHAMAPTLLIPKFSVADWKAHTYNTTEVIYPFTPDSNYTDYDFTELLMYVGGIWLIYVLYRFITKK